MKPEQLEAKFREALAIHQKGELPRAHAMYREVVAAEPRHAQAWHLLGVIALQTGQYQRAVDAIDAAIRVQPDHAVFHYNRGNALAELRQLEAAVASYRKALELNPGFAESYYSLGNALVALEELESAVACFDRAIALKPEHVPFHFNRGDALIRLGRMDAALAGYDRVVALAPAFAEAHSRRGKALLELGRFEASVASCEKAIQLKPELAEAYMGRGLALQQLKRIDAALADYDKATALQPGSGEAHHNRARALQELGQLDAAVRSYERSIQLEPRAAASYFNLGNVLLKLKNLNAAVTMYDRAIELKPDVVEGYYNRGIAFKELTLLEQAAADFTKALELNPDYEWLPGILLHTRMRICDWENIAADFERLARGLQELSKVSPPMPVLAMLDSPALHKRAAEIAARAFYPANDALGPLSKRPRKDRIRIGYYSADFHNHATSYLMAELFESHDRNRFELIAFSFGPDSQDGMRNRLRAAFDNFVDVREAVDLEVARLSRELEIDIAIDLKGFTDDSRCGIFAARSAPIQVSYLGYPGTLGTDYFEYLIADQTLIPPENRLHFAEKVVYLPHTYQVNDRKREISDKGSTREEMGLPPSGFVFCCFNRNYKITPDVFDIWMRVLRSVPGSVLWLFEDSPLASKNLRKEAQRRGVDAHRLVFAGVVPLAEHLERQRLADLFLDTLPYNAHTTTSDALWAGLPVLTRMGQSFPARVSASLLQAIGLPELVTQSEPEYERLAIELATDRGKLAVIKDKLARSRLTAPLFDSRLFTKHLEAAYLEMWDRYQADLPPDHIFVEP